MTTKNTGDHLGNLIGLLLKVEDNQQAINRATDGLGDQLVLTLADFKNHLHDIRLVLVRATVGYQSLMDDPDVPDWKRGWCQELVDDLVATSGIPVSRVSQP